MRSLTAISFRSLRRRKGRYVLTGIGIALGVAVAFSVLVTSGATNDALGRVTAGFAGDADVIVSPVGTFDANFPETTLEDVRRLDGVAHALGVHGARTSIDPPDDPEGSLIFLLYGMDAAEAQPVHHFGLRAGRLYRPGAPEVVVPQRFAEVADVVVGDRLSMTFADGQRTARVVGILENDGAGLANGGLVAYTSPTISREFAGQLEVLSRIDVVLADGVDLDSWVSDVQSGPGERYFVTPADDLAGGFADFLAGIQSALSLMAVLALFVGGFLIFLTFSVTVAERTRVYGTLRALGSTPRQVRRVVLVEGALLGVTGAAVGLALGYLISRASLGFVTGLVGLPVPDLGVPVAEGVVSAVVGIAITLVACVLPARRAAALSPVAAMREEARPDEGVSGIPLRVAVFAIGVALVLYAPGLGLQAVSMLLVLLGGVLLVPLVVRPVARGLGALTSRIGRGVGAIAVMHLVKERSRSAYTLALVMVVLAATLAIGGVNLSMQGTLDDVIDQQFGADLQVQVPGTVANSAGEEVADTRGVDVVSPVRFGTTEILQPDGDPLQSFVFVIDPATYFEVANFPWVDGDTDDARRALARGGSVVMGEPLAQRLSVGVGDDVSVRTSRGPYRLRVAGTYAVLGFNNGIAVSARDAEALLGAGNPMGFLVRLGEGADPDAVSASLTNRLEDRYDIVIETAADVKAFAESQLSGFFGLGYAIVLVSAIIGALGLANTLVVSVLQRTREIGILRSTGVLRRQLRAMVLAEAATLVLVAVALSIPLGGLLGWVAVRVAAESLGFTVGYQVPWALLPVLLVIALVVGALASLGPARRAARVDPVVALRFD